MCPPVTGIHFLGEVWLADGAAWTARRKLESQPFGPGAAPPEGESPPPIPPLHVAAVVVRKSDLIAALRIYVPQLADVTVLDTDRFLLSLEPDAPGREDGRDG